MSIPRDWTGARRAPIIGLSQQLTGPCRIPLVAIIVTLLYLHRRHNKRLKREDASDPHKSLDFGLDEAPTGGRNKRKSMLGAIGGNGKEKDHARLKQMSMDMNLSSPYLLPPGMHGSRESIQSLAKSIDPSHDPYRPVAQLVADGASIRSPSRGPQDSLYPTPSSESRNGRNMNGPDPFNAPGPRQNSFPRQPAPTRGPAHMKNQPAIPQLSIPSASPPAKDPFRSPSEMSRPSIDSAQFPDEKDFVVTPVAPQLQEPAPTAQQNDPRPMPQQQPVRSDSESSNGVIHHDQNGDRHRSQQAVIHERGPSTSNNTQSQGTSFAEPHAAGSILEEPQQYYDYNDYAHMPEGDYEQQGHRDHEERGRGRTQYRESVTSNYGQEPPQAQNGSLGIPQQDARRLSVGVRPLPPDELMDTEDPETRANRIRSFYKEYFDDSSPKPDVPEIPQHVFANQQRYHQQQGHQATGSVQYYEDYNQGYGGHGAEEPYYDPDSNAFVMPYAQPVARRAMTPPPSGSRFQGGGPRGPPGPPRGMQGMGPPGPRFQGSRPGSRSSSRNGGPPRPGSAMSQGHWGNRPRAGSSHSALAGGRAAPRKALPPPSPLTTLPTPSKLKDDSFALFNALEFAPPEMMKDRVAGRSQSPMGERRPYQVNVPAHSPLVNAFEELPSLPSP